MQPKRSLPTQMWTGWCVALCLLQLGGANAEVIQQPSLVLQEGHHAHLECNQTNKHDYMYWYQQKAGQGPDFLYYFIENSEQQKGNISVRFSAYQPKEYRLDLNISSVKREDSAVYFCASSQDTVLRSHGNFLQKLADVITEHISAETASPRGIHGFLHANEAQMLRSFSSRVWFFRKATMPTWNATKQISMTTCTGTSRRQGRARNSSITSLKITNNRKAAFRIDSVLTSRNNTAWT
ncbi:uncharacterized protein LOC143841428 [Paroedura picta]|uniref:uncharacterized protein LOC143841428 n=1 Tax=Paroedura picta TaxID=143630 RepID=UPI00405675C6